MTIKQHIDAIDRALASAPADLPSALVDHLRNNIPLLADKWDALERLLQIPPAQSDGIWEELSSTELMRETWRAWQAEEGCVIRTQAQGIEVYTLRTRTCEVVEALPPALAYSLGMLKLQEDRTFVRRCGYRHGNGVFYVLEGNPDET